MNVHHLEIPAGDGQLLVLYVNEDMSSQVEPESVAGYLATDAAQRLSGGWRLISVASMPIRQMGTAGNVLFQSGGQFATQVALIAVYSQAS